VAGPTRTVSIVSDDDARRTELLEAALADAARGWPVHRCKGKKPLTDDWPTAASTDEKVVTGWWSESSANIGVVTGARSGIVVLDVDIDPEKGIDGEATLAALVALHGPLPDTVEARTGRGGRHLYFRHPGHPVKTRAGSLGPGLDVRGDGGQVIVPPSRHPNGTHYTWALGHAPGDLDPAEMPVWLEDQAQVQRPAVETPQAPKSVLAALLDDPPGQGHRHDWLTSVAGSYASSSPDFATYAAQVKVTNTSMPDPLPDAEVDGIIKGIWAKEEAKVEEPPPWETPLPFATFDPPPFPVSALPRDCANFVAEEAEATQTPPDLAGLMVLSAVAAAVGGRISIRLRDDWIEPLNIYAVVALPPGCRKSAVVRDVDAPLIKFERDLIERYGPEIREKKSERRKLEKRLDHLHRELAKCSDGGGREGLAVEIATLDIELESTVVPHEPQLITDDATPEKLGSLLFEQEGRIAIMSAETSLFGMMAGRYSSTGAKVEIYLQGHSGDDLRVDRVGRDALHVPEPALTIGVAVQPSVLEGLLDVPILQERGVLARFLFSLPQSPLGRRQIDPPSMSGNTRARYEVMIEQLLDFARGTKIDGEVHVVTLALDPEAQRRLMEFRGEIEPMLGEFGDMAGITGWGSKLPGAVARIAGLLHVASHPDRPASGTVSATTLGAAIEIGVYLAGHAKAAFVVMGADKAISDAKHILRWIERNEKTDFSERDAYRTMTTRFKHPQDLHPGLTALESRGYIRRVPEAKGKGPGRRPSPRWEVNPALRSRN
jgi:replicative DNA helicase